MSLIQFDVKREGWQSPSEPVRSSSPFPGWHAINRIVIHYPGADWSSMDMDRDGDIDRSDTAVLLRNTQHYYLTQRGYSIGYNAAVASIKGHDGDGLSYELRGDDFKCAANVEVNGDSFAINVLVDGDAPATPKAVRKVRFLVAQARYLAGKPLPIVGHFQVGSTSCPGAGIKAQLARGAFEPRVK